MIACPIPDVAVGAVRGALYAIGCNVEGFSRGGYAALTGSASFLPQAVTALMVIYVGLLGFRLMFGIGTIRLGDVGIIGLKLGFVLTLAFNWTVFQTLVFDLAFDAPAQVAGAVSRAVDGGGLAGDPVNGLQFAYDELGRAATTQGPQPDAAAAATTTAAGNPEGPPGAAKLLRAQGVLLYGTVGVVAVAMVALGILTTIGPLFIALAILSETLGLFIGWLRAMLAFTILSTLAWLANLMLLTTIEPWLAILRKGAGAASPAAQEAADIVAIVIDIFAAAQVALLGGAVIIACGLKAVKWGRRESPAEAARSPQPAPAPSLSRAERLGLSLQPGAATVRRPDIGVGISVSRGERMAAPGAPAASMASPAGRGERPGGASRRPSPFERLRKGEGRN